MNCKHCNKLVPTAHMPEDGFLVGTGIDSFYECPNCLHCFVSGRSFSEFAGPTCSYCRKPATGELRPTAGGKLLACVPCYHQRKMLATALLPGAHKDGYTKPTSDFIGTLSGLNNRAAG